MAIDYKKEYEQSEAVRRAQAALQQQEQAKPGAYQSGWQNQLNDIMGRIQNREKFNYDLNGDALYQQYKNQYMHNGNIAMQDTMGQAAAMTGGYGNTYAQQVGQQTYQGYLNQLNDKIPELYQLALNKYNTEGDELYRQYGMIGDRENQDYSRYMDALSQWQADRNYAANRYDTERDLDYSVWNDNRTFNYGMDRDSVADQQWQAQFDEDKRRYDQEWDLKYGAGAGGSGGGGYDDQGLRSDAETGGDYLKAYVKDGLNAKQWLTLNNAVAGGYESGMNALDDLVKDGSITTSEADALAGMYYPGYKTSEDNPKPEDLEYRKKFDKVYTR